jgi:CHASE3 domain sensor protein
MISRMSLKAKLAAGFGALLVILVTMGVISYTSVQKLSELSAFGDKKANARFFATSIDSLINNQKSEYRVFLLANQETEMTRYAENNRKLAEQFDKLEATLTSDKGKELVAHLRKTLDAYHGLIDRVVELHRAGKQKEAIELMTVPESDAVRADLASPRRSR